MYPVCWLLFGSENTFTEYYINTYMPTPILWDWVPWILGGLLLCFISGVCGNECTAETVIIIVIIITGAFFFFFFSACVITTLSSSSSQERHNSFIYVFRRVRVLSSFFVRAKRVHEPERVGPLVALFFLPFLGSRTGVASRTYIRTYTYFSCSCLA